MIIKNQKAFTLVEMLMVVLITAVIVAGGAVALTTGQSSWFTTEAGIQIQESLRKALDQMTAELRQTKFANVTISAGTGANGSDKVLFSIPVICHTGDSLLDANGDVAHWGATLRWGCRDATCMDADNICATVEYKDIQYELIAGNQLARNVLDNAGISVRQDIIALNISDFQANLTGAQGIHLDVTALANSVLNRSIILTVGSDVIFRNQ